MWLAGCTFPTSALMKRSIKSVYKKASRNTINSIYMRSEDASSLLSYVFQTQYKALYKPPPRSRQVQVPGLSQSCRPGQNCCPGCSLVVGGLGSGDWDRGDWVWEDWGPRGWVRGVGVEGVGVGYYKLCPNTAKFPVIIV